MANYLPNMRLADGTMICGPMVSEPKDGSPFVEIEVNGKKYYCVYSGDNMTDQARDELFTRAAEWIAERSEIYP